MMSNELKEFHRICSKYLVRDGFLHLKFGVGTFDVEDLCDGIARKLLATVQCKQNKG